MMRQRVKVGSVTGMTTTYTDRDARNYLATAITQDGDDFDLEAILTECREQAGGWNFDEIPHDTFWAIVAKHDRSA